jgi:hypothetical protein
MYRPDRYTQEVETMTLFGTFIRVSSFARHAKTERPTDPREARIHYYYGGPASKPVAFDWEQL